jgi:hypothetical protein
VPFSSFPSVDVIVAWCKRTYYRCRLYAVDWNTIITVLATLVVAILIRYLANWDYYGKKDEGKENEEGEKKVKTLKADNFNESIKLNFETVKHLATLAAGSFVVIATFLKDIFPKDGTQPTDLTPLLKLLVAATFLCFAISLIFSAWGLWGLAIMPRTGASINDKKKLQHLFVQIPAFFLITGLGTFGVAVLINLLELGTVANICLAVLLIYTASVLGLHIQREYKNLAEKESNREYKLE